MQCGFYKTTINPPLGTPIIGYYAERLTKGIIDDLYAKAIAFESDGTKAVILQLDLCLMPEETCDEIRKTVASFCDIDADAVFISCNHTHTGPLTCRDFASDKLPDPNYMAFLKTTARDAAAYALEDLKPARFFVSETQAKGISFVRRFRMKDGSVRTNPDAQDPNIDHPLGEPNETVKLLKILREGGDDIYLFNFGTHSDTVSGCYISADYSGYACAALEGAIPGIQAVFILAPQGDVNHYDVSKPHKGCKNRGPEATDAAAHARYMGRVIAGSLLTICDQTTEIGTKGIKFATSYAEIPSHQENHKLEASIRINDLYEAGRSDELNATDMKLASMVAEARRVIRLQNGPASFTKKLSALKVGDYVFAGFAGEPFTDIRNRVDGENRMICALWNGSGGYFPHTQAYEEGGYEVLTSSFGPGTDDILVNGMTELLKGLK